MAYYPLFLDVKNRPCVVIGGGGVALRKVNMLLDHEARVQVISPEFCAELESMIESGRASGVRRGYQSGDLEGAFVVIAATDDQQANERIAREAQDRGILINVVDVPALSNFIVPSYLRRGDLTIAVSTSGSSPALARKIRKKLEAEFGPEYVQLVSLVEEVRARIKGSAISGQRWQEALDIEYLLKLIRDGKRDLAKTELLASLRKEIR